jgi:hypothetical protein
MPIYYSLPNDETFNSLDSTEYILKDKIGFNIYNFCIYLIERFYCSDDQDFARIVTRNYSIREGLYKKIIDLNKNKTFHPAYFVFSPGNIEILDEKEFKWAFLFHLFIDGTKGKITTNSAPSNGKIIISKRNANFFTFIEKCLKKIDPNIQINRNGHVTTNKGNGCGNQLIMNILARKYTININEFTGDSRANTRPEDEVNKSNGIGTNVILAYDVNAITENIGQENRLSFWCKRKDGTVYETKKAPPEIFLGHELIHALHYVQGTMIASHDDFGYNIEGTDESGIVKTGYHTINRNDTIYPSEEARTTGLGTYQAEILTENKLRLQYGYDERITY